MPSFSFSNPVFAAADNSKINCIVQHPIFGNIPYTAAAQDSDPNCVATYNAIVAAGNVGPYVAPKKPAATNTTAPKTVA